MKKNSKRKKKLRENNQGKERGKEGNMIKDEEKKYRWMGREKQELERKKGGPEGGKERGKKEKEG